MSAPVDDSDEPSDWAGASAGGSPDGGVVADAVAAAPAAPVVPCANAAW
ncbi:hypothetical protein ACIQVC_02415 [Streptomyces sp. NPDC101112]